MADYSRAVMFQPHVIANDSEAIPDKQSGLAYNLTFKFGIASSLTMAPWNILMVHAAGVITNSTMPT